MVTREPVGALIDLAHDPQLFLASAVHGPLFTFASTDVASLETYTSIHDSLISEAKVKVLAQPDWVEGVCVSQPKLVLAAVDPSEERRAINRIG